MGFLKRGKRKHFHIFLVFFSQIFLPNLLFTKQLGCIYRDTRKMGGYVMVFWQLSRLFHLFHDLWSDLCPTIWRPFRALFYSNIISLENSRYLVSIGSDFVIFWAAIVEISRPEGRWCSVGDSVMFLLKKFIPSSPWQISSSSFCERWLRPHNSSWFSWIAPIFAQLVQFVAWNWSKNNLF